MVARSPEIFCWWRRNWSARELYICPIKIKMTSGKVTQQQQHDYVQTVIARDTADGDSISYMSEDLVRDNTRQLQESKTKDV